MKAATMIANMRKKQHMTQKEFASFLGVNMRTLQEWEQGRCSPSSPAMALLMVKEKEYDASNELE